MAKLPIANAGVPSPMAFHLCPVCKKPMKRVETDHYGPGWVFDCKCLDSAALPDDGGDPSRCCPDCGALRCICSVPDAAAERRS